MFFALFAKRRGELPTLQGPYDDFQAASCATDGTYNPIVIHWSKVLGWLHVWGVELGPSLLMESGQAQVLRDRVSHAEHIGPNAGGTVPGSYSKRVG